MKHTYDGERSRDDLRTTAPDGLYHVAGETPRIVPEWYDPVTDTFRRSGVAVVTVARVRQADGRPLPLVGECYQEGDRQVIFMDVPVDDL